jgi:hypothetical protein
MAPRKVPRSTYESTRDKARDIAKIDAGSAWKATCLITRPSRRYKVATASGAVPYQALLGQTVNLKGNSHDQCSRDRHTEGNDTLAI